MGKFQEGILGGFSGKVGPVIGSSWRGIQYMRGKGKMKRNKKVPLSIEMQRAKFKLVGSFLRSMKDLMVITFPDYTTKLTARNSAQGKILTGAITGEYPNFQIDYSRVELAKGGLTKTIIASVVSEQPTEIKFTWEDVSNVGTAKPDDTAIIVVYSEKRELCYFNTTDFLRSAGGGAVKVPLFKGEKVHTWLSFLSVKKTDVSNSIYTGAVTVL